MAQRISQNRVALMQSPIFRQMEGTLVALDIAQGSIAIPTDPRATGVQLYGSILNVNAGLRVNADAAATSGAYLESNETHTFALHPDITNLHFSGEVDGGTLFIGWLMAGSAG